MSVAGCVGSAMQTTRHSNHPSRHVTRPMAVLWTSHKTSLAVYGRRRAPSDGSEMLNDRSCMGSSDRIPCDSRIPN
jgi:hypothetical protein